MFIYVRVGVCVCVLVGLCLAASQQLRDVNGFRLVAQQEVNRAACLNIFTSALNMNTERKAFMSYSLFTVSHSVVLKTSDAPIHFYHL